MPRRRVCHLCQQTVEGNCPRCQPKIEAAKQDAEKMRGSAAKRGYGHKWRVEREIWLRRPENRWCFYCEQKTPPKKTIANIIDHFIPHRGDQKLFWDRKNWKPACETCHNIKTAKGQ
jgi:5-methylcytosine-specific restriction protein A